MQGNAVLVSQLYKGVIDALGGAKTVLDLYCGVGVMSVAIAKTGAKVIGVDDHDAAIRDARAYHQNKDKSDLNISFECMKAETYLTQMPDSLDLSKISVVMDPPRRGCESTLLDALIATPVAQIVMVSCSVDTMGRDLRVLCEGGYEIEFIQGYDMFCQTPHLEVLALLKRSSFRQRNSGLMAFNM